MPQDSEILHDPPLSDADLNVVVELQRAELDRLLRENARLNERIQQLIGMQEREQVLRQQMQTMLGEKPQPAPLIDANGLERRAKSAEQRYSQLKSALGHLLDALERKMVNRSEP